MSCGVGHRWGSDLTLLWLWPGPADAAPIGPLAWEPHAMGAALKRTKDKKKKKNLVCLEAHRALPWLSEKLNPPTNGRTSWWSILHSSNKGDHQNQAWSHSFERKCKLIVLTTNFNYLLKWYCQILIALNRSFTKRIYQNKEILAFPLWHNRIRSIFAALGYRTIPQPSRVG